jgi:hypothetical protein
MAKKQNIDGDGALWMTGLQIENVLRLRGVHLQLDDDGVLIVEGKNEQGKSSVIRSIEMVLGGGKAIAEDPIHGDENEGRIVAEFGDIKVERIFKRGKGPQLKVTSPGRKHKSPQSILTALMNAIALDPLKFFNYDDEKRRETIVAMQGVDLSAIEEKRSDAFDDRRDKNREAKRLLAVVESLKENPDLDRDDVGEEETSVSELLAKLKAAQEHNKEGDALDADAEKWRSKAVEMAATNKKIEAEIAELQGALEANRIVLAQFAEYEKTARDSLSRFIPEDEDEIQEQIDNIEQTNKVARLRAQYKTAYAEWEEAQESADAAQETLTTIDSEIERKRAEAGSRLAIDGLSITDGVIMYKGKPLSQAGTSAELRISIAVAIALNKNNRIKLLCIDDAESLDTDNTKLVLRMAKKAGFQVIMARVGDGKAASVLIDDGVVKEYVEEE